MSTTRPDSAANSDSFVAPFEHATLIRLLIDPEDGQIVRGNAAANQFYGYAAEDWGDLSMAEISNLSPETMREEMRRAVVGEQSFFRLRHRLANGKQKHVETFLAPVLIGGQSLLLSTVFDVSSKKYKETRQEIVYAIAKASQVSRSAAELYSVIQSQLSRAIEANNFYVALYDEDTHTLSLPYMQDEKDHGVTIPASKTLSYLVIESKRTRKFSKQEMVALRASGVIADFGTPSELWVGVPLTIPEGVIGMIAVQSYDNPGAYDKYDIELLEFVSQQIAASINSKLLEIDLVEKQKLLAESEELGRTGTLVWEIGQKFLSASEGLLRILGIPGDGHNIEMTGLLRLLSNAGREELAAYLDVGVREFSMESSVLRNDGEALELALRSTVSMHDEGADVLQILVQDISERKSMEKHRLQLELAVQQSQRVESLGVLAGGIAHDFNNVLASVLGNAELARAIMSDEHPAVENLKEIISSASHAAGLCRQMLAYSGKGKLSVVALDLAELVFEMAEMIRVSISRRIRLDIDFSNDLPRVRADATQLRQIVMNLIINAAEAIGDKTGVIAVNVGSRVFAEAALLAPWDSKCLPGGEYVFLEVRDDGCGMDDETKERLFDPFFSTKFAGRGLGMAAAQGIIRGHRGSISVSSTLGSGSSFQVCFPAISDADEKRSPSRDSDALVNGQDRMVLLVDDEEPVLMVTKKMLRHLGFRVVLARDGREAVAAFAAQKSEITAVIMDLAMPEMDGMAAFQEIRASSPEIPVLILSGYADDEVRTRFASGTEHFGFSQKPVTIEALNAALSALL